MQSSGRNDEDLKHLERCQDSQGRVYLQRVSDIKARSQG